MSAHPRRVSFYGGPGVGKSALAARIFAELKCLHLPVELVDEVIKPMAWQGIKPEGYDPGWLFWNQLHNEEVILRQGGIVVSSGPPLQQCVYMYERKDFYADDLLSVAQHYEKDYPSVNYNIVRNVPFQKEGRYQKTVEEAKKLDYSVTAVLVNSGLNWLNVAHHEVDFIMKQLRREFHKE